MARYPRYDENMNPYNGLGGDSGSIHYKGEYKKNHNCISLIYSKEFS